MAFVEFNSKTKKYYIISFDSILGRFRVKKRGFRSHKKAQRCCNEYNQKNFERKGEKKIE
jgi:hypothetical protein